MVKSVVKPLKMGFLRERIVPEKSVFTRDFGVFHFEIPRGRCLTPKAGALHPDEKYSVFILAKEQDGRSDLLGSDTRRRRLAVPDIFRSPYGSQNIDRCANESSLDPPQAALGCVAQSRRAMSCATSRHLIVLVPTGHKYSYYNTNAIKKSRCLCVSIRKR